MSSAMRLAPERCTSSCATCGALRAAVPDAVLRHGLRGVTVFDLAAGAQVPIEEAERHSLGGAAWHVRRAYAELIEAFLRRNRAAFAEAESWREGLETALTALAEDLADRPAVAHLCFVAILGADRDMLELRDQFRARHIRLLEEEHVRLCGDLRTAPPGLQFELLSGALGRALARRIAEGRVRELPDMVGEVLAAADVFEPLAA